MYYKVYVALDGGSVSLGHMKACQDTELGERNERGDKERKGRGKEGRGKSAPDEVQVNHLMVCPQVGQKDGRGAG